MAWLRGPTMTGAMHVHPILEAWIAGCHHQVCHDPGALEVPCWERCGHRRRVVKR